VYNKLILERTLSVRKVGALLGMIALGVATSTCQALTVSVNTNNEFDAFSTNSVAGSQLEVLQIGGTNPGVVLLPTESNLALGQMATGFFSGQTPQVGAYTFSNVPANFDIVITDTTNPADTTTLNVLGFISGTTNVNSIAPPVGSNSLTYTVTSVGGSSSLGAFNNGTPAIVDAFNFFGNMIEIKVRQTQSPPLFGASNTAIEGRIIGPAAVPEPGTIAMLIGMGVSSSLLALRRRRRL